MAKMFSSDEPRTYLKVEPSIQSNVAAPHLEYTEGNMAMTFSPTCRPCKSNSGSRLIIFTAFLSVSCSSRLALSGESWYSLQREKLIPSDVRQSLKAVDTPSLGIPLPAFPISYSLLGLAKASLGEIFSAKLVVIGEGRRSINQREAAAIPIMNVSKAIIKWSVKRRISNFLFRYLNNRKAI